MLKKPFMKTSSLAMAVAAAFLLGGAAQAQQPAPAGVATPGGAMSQAQGNLPAGTTKSQNDAVMPAPTAGTGSTGATSSSGMSGSGKAMAAPGGIAGTTNPQDNIANPAPMAGMAKSPEMRDEMAAKKAAKKGNKKSTRNKGMSNSSTNDTGTTSAPGTQ